MRGMKAMLPGAPALGAMALLAAAAWTGAMAGETGALADAMASESDLDSAAIKERISDMNLSKSLDKVAFSGLIYNRAFNHQYLEFPANLGSDASGTSYDANFTLKVSINASPLIKVWSMLSFGYDFGGNFLNQKAFTHPRTSDLPGFGPVQDTVYSDMGRVRPEQDKNREAARVFEDLMAGVDIRTEAVDANVRAGGTLWMQGSPLTIWKRDPRQHPAWYFESYEPEQSSAQYYTQKFYYRRNDLGRASWPKKAFGGMEVDAFKLPADMGFQFDFAQPSNMLPSKTDGNTNSHAGDAEALNSINSLGQLYFGRLTRRALFKDVTGGLNLLWVEIPKDIVNQKVLSPNPVQGFKYQFRDGGQPFYTNPRVFSLDSRGNLAPGMFWQSDIALSLEDTVKYLPFINGADTVYDGRSSVTRTQSKPAPAAYAKLNTSGSLPMETEVFFAAKDFWSPYAVTEYAVPVHRDEMKLGTGSFSYQSNLVGLNWKVSPKVTTGFLSLTLGQHVQAEKGKDLLRFQHTVNGREAWYSTTSWSRTEPGRMLDEGSPYGNPRYEGRVGEIHPGNDILHLHNQPGGLHGDDLEVWEEFAAYDNAAQANAGQVPQNQKYSFSSALDWGYNVGSLIGYERPFMVALYSSVNTISKTLTGPLNNGNTLLWSGMARFEPAISLSPTFQMLGLIGLETWKSDKAYRNKLANKQGVNDGLTGYQLVVGSDGKPVIYDNIHYYEPISSYAGASLPSPLVDAELSPIDYMQMAYGLGFDWDFSERAGLHVRCKYATHEDKNLPSNNWKGAFVFGETKIWF
ncbi:MAG: hypothetical protein JWP91_2945 [Fibrobacteres bacterium]|nr:hypothetical protein [Fibrobacterota bacterium]